MPAPCAARCLAGGTRSIGGRLCMRRVCLAMGCFHPKSPSTFCARSGRRREPRRSSSCVTWATSSKVQRRGSGKRIETRRSIVSQRSDAARVSRSVTAAARASSYLYGRACTPSAAHTASIRCRVPSATPPLWTDSALHAHSSLGCTSASTLAIRAWPSVPSSWRLHSSYRHCAGLPSATRPTCATRAIWHATSSASRR